MYIKIYNKSQLILLEQINPLLGKYRLPLELLAEVEKILACEKIGKKGFYGKYYGKYYGNYYGQENK